jgi:tetratricopeptide (TPR) repeat protein
VKQALERVALGPRGQDIGPSCVADLACLANSGAETGARRLMVVSISNDKVTIELQLVDVEAKEQIGKREVTLSPRKIERELAPALRKFLDEAPVERAKALATKGNEHYTLGELALALAAYKRAYQVKPLPDFLFNIAQCHRRMGQHREAITMYQSYLVDVPDAENKALVEELLAESKSALEKGDRSEQQRIEDLRAAREAEARAAAERRREREARSRKSIVPWLAIGIGAAAIIGGGILYATSETDTGEQFMYRDSRPPAIGITIGGAALVGTGIVWMTAF